MKILFNGYAYHFQGKNKYFDYVPMMVHPVHFGFDKIHIVVLYEKANTYSKGNATKIAYELIKQKISDPKVFLTEKKVKGKFFALFEFYSESAYAKFIEEKKFKDAEETFKRILNDLEWHDYDYSFKDHIKSILDKYPDLLTDEACAKLAEVDNQFKQRVVDGKYKYVIFPSKLRHAELTKMFTGTSITSSIIKFRNESSGFWLLSSKHDHFKYAMMLTTSKKSDLAYIKMCEKAWEE